MGLFDRIRSEVKSAGNAARGAIDEGRIRIEIFRARQQADAAAQSLGYALHRARRDGRELDAATLERLDAALARHEADATRLAAELVKSGAPSGPPPAADAPTGAGTAAPPSASGPDATPAPSVGPDGEKR